MSKKKRNKAKRDRAQKAQAQTNTSKSSQAESARQSAAERAEQSDSGGVLFAAERSEPVSAAPVSSKPAPAKPAPTPPKADARPLRSVDEERGTVPHAAQRSKATPTEAGRPADPLRFWLAALLFGVAVFLGVSALRAYLSPPVDGQPTNLTTGWMLALVGVAGWLGVFGSALALASVAAAEIVRGRALRLLPLVAAVPALAIGLSLLSGTGSMSSFATDGMGVVGLIAGAVALLVGIAAIAACFGFTVADLRRTSAVDPAAESDEEAIRPIARREEPVPVRAKPAAVAAPIAVAVAAPAKPIQVPVAASAATPVATPVTTPAAASATSPVTSKSAPAAEPLPSDVRLFVRGVEKKSGSEPTVEPHEGSVNEPRPYTPPPVVAAPVEPAPVGRPRTVSFASVDDGVTASVAPAPRTAPTASDEVVPFRAAVARAAAPAEVADEAAEEWELVEADATDDESADESSDEDADDEDADEVDEESDEVEEVSFGVDEDEEAEEDEEELDEVESPRAGRLDDEDDPWEDEDDEEEDDDDEEEEEDDAEDEEEEEDLASDDEDFVFDSDDSETDADEDDALPEESEVQEVFAKSDEELAEEPVTAELPEVEAVAEVVAEAEEVAEVEEVDEEPVVVVAPKRSRSRTKSKARQAADADVADLTNPVAQKGLFNDDESAVAAALPEGERDQLVYEAGRLFVLEGRVAVSMLQKRFGLDFKQATEILDELQERGLIGPYLGGTRREILMDAASWRETVGAA